MLAVEQEILRVHGRAERAVANQVLLTTDIYGSQPCNITARLGLNPAQDNLRL